MRAHRMTATAFATLVALAGGLALGGVPAQAAFTHNYISDITEVPEGANATLTGQITPWSLSLSAGNLYIDNIRQATVDDFTTAGVFVSQISSPLFQRYSTRSIAVGGAGGRIYVPTYPVVYVFNAAEEYEATWEGLKTPGASFGYEYNYVAVDNSTNVSDPARGAVYVTDSGSYGGSGHKVVDVIKPGAGGAETYEAQITGTSPTEPFGYPLGVAVDEANGDVYVVDAGNNDVDVFQPEAGGKYGFLRQITGPPVEKFQGIGGVAIDPTEGAVYVTDPYAAKVYQFSSTGSFVDAFNLAANGQPLQSAEGVAAGPEGDVFVADYYANPSRVDVFGPAVLVPDVTTDAASEVQRVTATVAGKVNADKTKAKYYFEYGETSTFGDTTPAEESEGEETLALSIKLTGLKTSTTYSYRLVAENENGKNYGTTMTFTTLTAVEHLTTLATSGFAATEQTFNGELTPNGYATECWFEYEGGSTPRTKTAKQSAGEESKVMKLSQKVSGLEPNTEYRDTIACENTLGTSYGSELSAYTPPAPPEVIAESTSNIARQRAVLHAIVNPENESTRYYFEYGPTTEYGYDTSELEVSTAQFGERAVQAPASELESNTEYHYRVVAKNATGTVRGSDSTFKSGAFTPPIVTTGGVSALGQIGVTLEGLVTTQGLVTSYGFEITSNAEALTNPDAFGPPTGLGSIGAGFAEAPAILTVTGLAPGTKYYYKLIGTNPDGTSEGAVNEFTTLTYPPDQITVEELRVLTEPFVEWPASGAFVNSASPSTEAAPKHGKAKHHRKHKKGKPKGKHARKRKK